MVTRPILRYHGGKWKLAPWVISHFPKHRVYVEPFGGAASVLLQKERAYAEVYNDISSDVVNLFRVLRDAEQADRLRSALHLTPFSRDEFVLSYSRTDCPVEMARRLIVRSFMGFGSAAHNADYLTGFRRKSFRSGTSPAWDWGNYPDSIPAVVERLRGVCIENRPALNVIDAMDREDVLFYVDPPYVMSTRQGRDTYEHELTDADHEKLASALHACKGMVVLSGYPCDLYRDLYADWRMVTRKAYADKASPRTECLWLSPNITPAQGRLMEVV